MSDAGAGAGGDARADRPEPTVVDALRERVADGPPLDVSADLTVAVDGHECRVVAFTDLVVVEAPSLPAALALLWRFRGRLPAATALLAAADLTAELRAGGATVARAGSDATPGPLARLAGLGPGGLRPRGVVRALLGV